MIKKYEHYKESGVEWIGEIPEYWEVRKLRFLLKNGYFGIKIGPFGSALKLNDMAESGYKVYGQENVIKNDFTVGKRFLSSKKYKDMQAYKLESQDILLTMMGTHGKCQVAPHNINEGIIDSHLIRLRTNNLITPCFFQIQMNYSQHIKDQIEIMTKGSIMSGLNSSIIKNIILFVPTLLEQQAIATYLDKKSQAIDQFIKNKESLISLLEEEKKAIITKAVTKGLDKNIKLKNSGVDWIGDIPQHWLLIKIKRLAKKITDGEHISPKFTLEGMPFLSAKDVRDKQINTNVNKFVSYNDGIKFRKRCNPSLGDILIVSRGATIGRIGLLETNDIFCLLGSVILIKPKNDIINYNYFFYLLNHEKVQEQLFFSSESSAQQAIYITNISNLFGFIPPLEEQQQIVAYLDKETQKIDDLKAKYRQEIDLIKEYKERLIYDVVTGKINVMQE